MTDPLARRLEQILQGFAPLIQVMDTARALALPDWMVFAGAIYQPVWNHLTGRPIGDGVRDFDLAYFDDADLSWNAEDAVIRRVAAILPAPLAALTEVRNQARVHLWFEDHFGEPYAPLTCSSEAVSRFAAPAFAVGARLEADGRFTIVAPFGLEDLFALRIRPNPAPHVKALRDLAARAQGRWPDLAIELHNAADPGPD